MGVVMQIMPDETHVIEGGRLDIFGVSASEAGFYTCVAWNAMGTDQHTVSISVITGTTSQLPLLPPSPIIPSLPLPLQLRWCCASDLQA